MVSQQELSTDKSPISCHLEKIKIFHLLAGGAASIKWSQTGWGGQWCGGWENRQGEGWWEVGGRNRERFHNSAYNVIIIKWAKRRKLRKEGSELGMQGSGGGTLDLHVSHSSHIHTPHTGI